MKRRLETVLFQDLFAIPLRNGLTRPKSMRGVGTKMVNMGELFAYSRIGNIQMDRVPLSDKEADYLLEPGDLLFARQSLVLAGAGKCSFVLKLVEPATFESHIIRARLDKRLANPMFYYYFFDSARGRQLIESIVEQVAAAGIRGSDLARLQVPYPPLNKQNAIVQILSALDDKIELNSQMSKTLEAIATAVFRSWFIGFDPVRAKMEGSEPYGMDVETAALFSNSFEISPLGEIPKGWHVDKFSTMIELIGGGTPKTSVPEYWNGTIPWFSVADTPKECEVFVIDTERKITEEGLHNSSTRILTPGTTIISARGTVGKCALVGRPMAMNQTCYGVRGKGGRGNYFIYFALRNLVRSLQQSSHGTVFDTITRDTFETIKVVCPPIAQTQRFDTQVSIYLDQILLNLHQTQTLTTIRDMLLPKLLSGEIRVREAEKVVEAHV